MAIADGLLVRMQAAAGQAAPTNEVGAGETLSSAGTMTLVDVGSEKAWNFTGGAATATLTTGRSVDGTTDGGGATLAIRLRVNTLPSGSFDTLVGIGVTTDPTTGLHIGRSGTNYRGRLTTSHAVTGGAIPIGTTFTLVLRAAALAASTSDSLMLWRDTVGRVGTSADYESTGRNLAAYALDKWIVSAINGADLDILDYLFWGRELTDAEAAAVADGIRTQLPLSGGGGATGQPFPPSLHSRITTRIVRFQ